MDLIPSTSRYSPSPERGIHTTENVSDLPDTMQMDTASEPAEEEPYPVQVKVESLRVQNSGSGPVYQRARSCVPVVDIHDVISPVRLLIRHPKNKLNLQLEDIGLTDQVVLHKSVCSLVSFISTVPFLEENDRYPPPVRALYRKLRSKQQNEKANDGFVYALVIHRLLSKIFHSPEDQQSLTEVYTDWMVFLPEPKSVMDRDPSDDFSPGRSERVAKLRGIRRIARSKYFAEILGVLDSLNNLQWVEPAESKPVSSKSVEKISAREFVKDLLEDPGDVLENPDVIRILSRICRITENVESKSVRQHFRGTVELLRASDPDNIPDIEDGLRTAARLICTEKAPKCPTCPVKSICNGYKRYVAEAVFSRLFIRFPQFLSYTLAKECQNDKECLLCSLDPSKKTAILSVRRSGLEKYPAKNHLARRHAAVCIVENPETNEFCFVRGERPKQYQSADEDSLQLIRLDLGVTEMPSSDFALNMVETHLMNLLNPNAVVQVQRAFGCDYVETDETCVTGYFFYHVTTSHVALPSSGTSEEQGSWHLAEDLIPTSFSAQDWNDFQNLAYSKQMISGTNNAGVVAVKATNLPDSKRLQLLYEASVKRLGSTKYPDIP